MIASLRTNRHAKRCRTAAAWFASDLKVDGHRIFVDVGFSPSGKPLEIFCSGLATGSGLAALLNDFACLTSISLQHGVSPATIARSIGRNEEVAGKPATSIFGAVMDLLAKEAVQAPLI